MALRPKDVPVWWVWRAPQGCVSRPHEGPFTWFVALRREKALMRQDPWSFYEVREGAAAERKTA